MVTTLRDKPDARCSDAYAKHLRLLNDKNVSTDMPIRPASPKGSLWSRHLKSAIT